MRITRIIATGLATTALLATTAAPMTAQDDPGLEGTQWTLIGYADGSDTTDVPIGIDASLLLEDGTASGSSGCNSFSGGYTLDGDALSFDEAFTTTLRACIGDAGGVESGFYAALPRVESWSLAGSTLELLDADLETVLTFDTSTPGAISALYVAALVERIEMLESKVAQNGERIDNVNISKLRERIRTLEADNQTLKTQVAQLRAGSGSSGGSGGGSGGGSSSNFNAAELALLKGVPERFHGRCEPLRSDWPYGTEAAVSCRPNTNRVTRMEYYLMESGQAADLFDITMSNAGVPRYGDIVPEGTQLCDEAVPSAIAVGGGYLAMEGCFRESGKAMLHVTEQLTSCRQLKAGSSWIERPALYVALTGPDADIKALHTWANRLGAENMSPLIVPINDPSAPATPDCFLP